MSEVRIAAEPRTEFGKGAARRTRRAGKVPAVLYGHGTDPRHISLPGHELMLALKSANVLLRLQGLDGGDELALPKDVQRDPLKGFLEHVDLIVVTRGEKVTVEVPVQLTGDIAPDGMLDQQMIQVSVEAEATHIPRVRRGERRGHGRRRRHPRQGPQAADRHDARRRGRRARPARHRGADGRADGGRAREGEAAEAEAGRG